MATESIDTYRNSIDIIIVLYEQEVKDITSLQYFLHSPLVRSIHICDNSKQAHDSHYAFDNADRIQYHWMGGNVGLPKAYNYAISKSDARFICIMDDDTTVPDDFLEKASHHFIDKPAVYLPFVRTDTGIMSPNRQMGYEVAEITIGDYSDMQHISGINSGMILSRQIFNKVKYDEALFLDKVDHRLIDEIHELNIPVIVMDDVVLHQSFSLDTYNYKADLHRFRIWKKDTRTYYSFSKDARKYGNHKIFARRMHLIKKYRSIRFLFI